MKNYFFGSKIMEKNNMDFVHKRVSVTKARGSAPWTPWPNFGQFFIFFKKNKMFDQKNKKKLKHVDFMTQMEP